MSAQTRTPEDITNQLSGDLHHSRPTKKNQKNFHKKPLSHHNKNPEDKKNHAIIKHKRKTRTNNKPTMFKHPPKQTPHAT